MTDSGLAMAKGCRALIDFDVDKVRDVGIFCENAAPARFGKRAAEPEADGSQFTIRLAMI
ncbi:MAG TPA: hypothetical protein VN689_08030 [Burkholderiales bacterium]|nr:hypothetical protein [Burkholderiales bacterium]